MPLPLAAQEQAPSAFVLLDEVRQVYGALTNYRDRGEIERVTREGGLERVVYRQFETASAEGGFLFRLFLDPNGGPEERALWTDEHGSFTYNGTVRQFRQIPTPVSELVQAMGSGSLEALVVPILLSGGDGLSDPEAAAVEGPEPCDEGSCWVLTLSRMAGTIESTLWIDQESSLVRRVEVVLAPASPNGGQTTLRVRHQPLSIGEVFHAGYLAFSPPADARRVEAWEVTEAARDDVTAQLGFMDEITVALTSIVTRIVDSSGEPIQGLEPEDLVVRVKKQEIPVVAIDWYTASDPQISISTTAGSATESNVSRSELSRLPQGKLVLIFIQADFNAVRIKGQLRLLPLVQELLTTLHPGDQVAVVTFDSHLKVWHDFSRDRQKIATVLEQAIRFGGAPLPRPSRDGPSFMAHFDSKAGRRVATPEAALLLTGETLASLPGEKEMIYLGWGLGRFGSGGLKMRTDFPRAIHALTAARTTVFVLDVTDADFHTLEVGLQGIAAETGGTYAKTNRFASQATKRLARTLTGYYVVTLDRSQLPDIHGDLIIEMRDKKRGKVHYRPLTLR